MTHEKLIFHRYHISMYISVDMNPHIRENKKRINIREYIIVHMKIMHFAHPLTIVLPKIYYHVACSSASQTTQES